jgi:hypothetical protein
MCKVQAAIAVALAVGLVQGVASAQSHHGGGGGGGSGQGTGDPHTYKAQPLNLQKGTGLTNAYATAARNRMKAGDCAGALESFDAALRSTGQDPTLYRDRGICHETLGHPYPAIDDYREYLTDMPDAADAEGIRQRLTRLEDQTSGRSETAAANDDTDVPPATATATVTVNGTGASNASNPTARDKLQYLDAEDDPLNAVLRRGKGFALAPFFSLHHWFFSGSSFGDAVTWSETVGGQLRYEVGPVGGILLEVGYEHFNATSVDPFEITGFTSLLGFEFRLPLDAAYDNQLLVTPAFGYEHISFTASDASFDELAANAIVPRFRFGYRHLIDATASLDVSADVGFAKWFVSSNEGTVSSDKLTPLVALNVGIVWGL